MNTNNNTIENVLSATAKFSTSPEVIAQLNGEENSAKKALLLLTTSNNLIASGADLHKAAMEIFQIDGPKFEKSNWRKMFKVFIGAVGGWTMEDENTPISDAKQKAADEKNGTDLFTKFNRFQATCHKFYDFENRCWFSDEQIAAMNKKRAAESRDDGTKGYAELVKQKLAHEAEVAELVKTNDETLQKLQKEGAENMQIALDNGVKSQATIATLTEQLRLANVALDEKSQELVAAQSATQINTESVTAFLTETAKATGKAAYTKQVKAVIKGFA